MKHPAKATLITLTILGVIVLIGIFVIYELKSPNGYFAKRNADIVSIVHDETLPYTNLSGNAVNIADFQGKPLIINMWASWSPFSQGDLKALGEIKKEYGDKISVVAMNRMETKETALAYLNTIGREEGIEYLIDQDDHLFSTIEGYAMPETLFYDEIGNLVFHKRGSLTSEELKDYVSGIVPQE